MYYESARIRGISDKKKKNNKKEEVKGILKSNACYIGAEDPTTDSSYYTSYY